MIPWSVTKTRYEDFSHTFMNNFELKKNEEMFLFFLALEGYKNVLVTS